MSGAQPNKAQGIRKVDEDEEEDSPQKKKHVEISVHQSEDGIPILNRDENYLRDYQIGEQPPENSNLNIGQNNNIRDLSSLN